jgi:hypothetical protein
MPLGRSIKILRAACAASAVLLACSSSDDVVAEVIPPQQPPAAGTAAVVIGGGTTASGASASGSRFALPAPIAVEPNLPSGAGVPAPAGAVLVAGTPRSVPSVDAEPWPLSVPLRELFGAPGPNEPVLYRDVPDPIDAEALRELGRSHGLVPGGPPVFVIVVDELGDQYDVSIREGG